MDILQVTDLSFAYDESRPLLQNVNLSVGAGQMVTILGPNGSGKSTLLNCIMGLLTLNTGSVTLSGKDIRQCSRREIANYLGYLPQQLADTFAYTVLDYVVMGRAPYISTFRKPTQKDYEIAWKALEDMEITDLSERMFGTLSGGERQQAAIARILTQRPKIILLDEPTSALDFGNQVKVIRLARQLAEYGYGVVMTTHNPDHAILLQDMVCVIERNGVVRTGTVEDIITEEYMSYVYQVDVKIDYMASAGRNTCLAVL